MVSGISRSTQQRTFCPRCTREMCLVSSIIPPHQILAIFVAFGAVGGLLTSSILVALGIIALSVFPLLLAAALPSQLHCSHCGYNRTAPTQRHMEAS